MAGTVHQDDAITRAQPLAKCEPHVLQITAGTVNEQERRRVGHRMRTPVEIDNVQAAAADLDETAGRRMRALDHARADERDDRSEREQCNDNVEGDDGHAWACRHQAPRTFGISMNCQGLGMSPTGTSMIAGSLAARLPSSARRKASGLLTRWPPMPKLSASFMKSGLARSLPMTRLPCMLFCMLRTLP